MRALTPQECNVLANMHRKGFSNNQIAKFLGCHANTVSRYIKNYKLNKWRPDDAEDGQRSDSGVCEADSEGMQQSDEHPAW